MTTLEADGVAPQMSALRAGKEIAFGSVRESLLLSFIGISEPQNLLGCWNGVQGVRTSF